LSVSLLSYSRECTPAHPDPFSASQLRRHRRQMQMGIIVGLGANVVFALWRYLIAVDDQHL
jgi:hypothetical protein